MRIPVISFLLLAAGTAPADTIVLKNGRTIYADVVREAGDKVQYDIGEDTYAIPRSLVARIESGGTAPARSEDASLPVFTPAEATPLPPLSVTVVRDGRVDREALATAERGSAGLAASAYLAAALHERKSGRLDQARTYFQRAVGFTPNDPLLLIQFVALLVRMDRAEEAAPLAERAARMAPNLADAHAATGFAYYRSDRLPQAQAAFRKALQLRPDPELKNMLEKVERELSAEASFSETSSSHFTLRYEGGKGGERLGREILQTLEQHYGDLAGQLGTGPRSVGVVLYPDKSFFDVTRAPAWTSAINDGKVRIPTGGMTTVTPEFSRVLKHELAHSFVSFITRARCPQWLQEAVAQYLEPQTLGRNGLRLSQMFARREFLPYNSLERSFMQFSDKEATVAYAQSLAVAEYVADTYGVSDLRRILERIGAGASAEAALRATLRTDYARLEGDIAAFLKRKYGE